MRPSYTPIPELNILRVTGAKAGAFLHGQFSNSIQDLKTATGCYNLFLTNKGKVVADAHAIKVGEDFLILTHKNHAAKISAHLERLAPLSGCRITFEKICAAHVFDDAATSAPLYSRQETSLNGVAVALFRSDRFGIPGRDIILSDTQSADWPLILKQHELLSEATCELIRIKHGIPRVGIDVTEDNLPQEGLLDHALHFEKGCYLGQEVIARLHYKGHVNRILKTFSCDGALGGHDITDAAGVVIGRVTSTAFDAHENKTYLLGYVPARATAETRHFVGNVALEQI